MNTAPRNRSMAGLPSKLEQRVRTSSMRERPCTGVEETRERRRASVPESGAEEEKPFADRQSLQSGELGESLEEGEGEPWRARLEVRENGC